jgi:hypothetical protein
MSNFHRRSQQVLHRHRSSTLLYTLLAYRLHTPTTYNNCWWKHQDNNPLYPPLPIFADLLFFFSAYPLHMVNNNISRMNALNTLKSKQTSSNVRIWTTTKTCNPLVHAYETLKKLSPNFLHSFSPSISIINQQIHHHYHSWQSPQVVVI